MKGQFHWCQFHPPAFLEPHEHQPHELAPLKQTPFLCCRMTTSSLTFRLSRAGPNRSQAGRRPPSTACTEATGTLRLPKSSLRPARADTLCSAARTREETSCPPNSWSDSWARPAKRRGLQGSSVTSTTSTLPATRSLGSLSAPKGRIQTRFCLGPARTDQLPKKLSASVTVKSSLPSVFYSGLCFDVTVGPFSFHHQIISSRMWSTNWDLTASTWTP